MSDTYTNNKDLLLISNGSASGTWGTVLNNSVFTIVDQALGNTATITVSNSDVNLSTSQIQNLALNVTGSLSGAVNLVLPLNANSTTQAVGGLFVINNNATGAFNVTVKTIASGSVGVVVPQNIRTVVYSDGTNVYYADDAQRQVQTFNGNPNGNVAGVAGSAATWASKVLDYTTNQEYLCTTTGTAGAAVWSIRFAYTMPSQGFLTPNSDAVSPVLTTDSVGATAIYLTGMNGNLVWIYNGTSFTPNDIPGSQVTITLSGSSQASNGIYDVMAFVTSTGTFQAGFSPAWATPTAGSGARGAGAGTPQLTRVNGILVNAVQQTINNGPNSFTVAANRATYLGSVSIDASAGQVSCYRSYGQSRKFGVWNYYNRKPIILQMGDPTANWTYNTATIRSSNGNAANVLSTFAGMAEEISNIYGTQIIQTNTNNGPAGSFGLGLNSTSSFSGKVGFMQLQVTNTLYDDVSANLIVSPSLGINNIFSLEKGNAGINTQFQGTNTNMIVTASYQG